MARGLVLLYPVSAQSVPVRGSLKTREPLEAVEHVVGVGLVFPESQFAHRAGRLRHGERGVDDASTSRPRTSRTSWTSRRRDGMIDEVRLTFMALRDDEAPPRDELKVVPLGEVAGRLSRRSTTWRRPHLLLASGRRSTGPELGHRRARGSVARTRRSAVLRGVSRRRLSRSQSVAEVFDHFIVAVIDRLEAGAGAPRRSLSEKSSISGGTSWSRRAARPVATSSRRSSANCSSSSMSFESNGAGDRRMGRPVRGSTRSAACRRQPSRSRPRGLTRRGSSPCTARISCLSPTTERCTSISCGSRRCPTEADRSSNLVDEILAAGAPAQELFHALGDGRNPAR